jgi:hypothetical protein
MISPLLLFANDAPFILWSSRGETTAPGHYSGKIREYEILKYRTLLTKAKKDLARSLSALESGAIDAGQKLKAGKSSRIYSPEMANYLRNVVDLARKTEASEPHEQENIEQAFLPAIDELVSARKKIDEAVTRTRQVLMLILSDE